MYVILYYIMLLSASRSFISKYLCRTFYNPRPRHTLTNHPMILNLIMHHTTPYYASPHVSHHFAIPISCYTTSHHILPTTPPLHSPPHRYTPYHTLSHLSTTPLRHADTLTRIRDAVMDENPKSASDCVRFARYLLSVSL